MKLKLKNDYLDFLNVAKDEIEKINLDTNKIESAKEVISNAELLVPIVGSFSSGKSSIINSLLGTNLLPVSVSPETDLASELRFSERERVEAIKEDGTFDEFKLTEFDLIKDKAESYEFLRVHINNLFLEEVQPLVLVDMPGFDSSFDSHNKAIFRYINKGVHYIVLVSSQDGTIPKSTINNLSHIDETNQGISVFISKSDLKCDAELEDLEEEVTEIAEEYLNFEGKVLRTSYKQPDELKKSILSINPEELFRKHTEEFVKSVFSETLEPLSVMKSTLKSSLDEKNAVLAQLERSKNDLEIQRDASFNSIKSRFSSKILKRCKSEVERSLLSQVHYLASQLKSPNTLNAANNELSDIIRNSVLRTLKQSIKEVTEHAVDETSVSLKALNIQMNSLAQNDNWSEDVSSSIKQGFNNLNDSLHKLQNGIEKLSEDSEKWRSTYRVVASITAITTTIVAPVVELVILFLPDILKALDIGNNSSKLAKRIEQEIIPQVLNKLDMELPDIIDEQLEFVASNVNEAFNRKLSETQNSILNIKDDLQRSEEEKSQQIEGLNNAKAVIESAASSYIFK